jgi:phage shock protein C
MTQKKVLKRSHKDRVISGVCGGLAEYFNIHSGLLRMGLIFLIYLMGPLVITGYFIYDLCIPSESKSKPNSSTIDEDGFNDHDLNREFDTLDKNLSRLEKKLANLEDLAIRKHSF